VDQQNQEPIGFSEHEYAAIATNTSQALQMMALLLTIYFLFNGALLTAMFTLLASTWGHKPLPYFRWLEIIDAVAISCFVLTLAFTFWSYYFVRSFRESVGIALSRGSEIERLAYGNSSKDKTAFFSRMDDWIRRSRTPQALALCSLIFFVLIESFWFLLVFGNLLR
jgi:hypothetical protein